MRLQSLVLCTVYTQFSPLCVPAEFYFGVFTAFKLNHEEHRFYGRKCALVSTRSLRRHDQSPCGWARTPHCYSFN
jgi:hypothetical protein